MAYLALQLSAALVRLLNKKLASSPTFGIGHEHSSFGPGLFEESPHLVRVLHPDVISRGIVARERASATERADRCHAARRHDGQMASRVGSVGGGR
jgi:hypothetical protein